MGCFCSKQGCNNALKKIKTKRLNYLKLFSKSNRLRILLFYQGNKPMWDIIRKPGNCLTLLIICKLIFSLSSLAFHLGLLLCSYYNKLLLNKIFSFFLPWKSHDQNINTDYHGQRTCLVNFISALQRHQGGGFTINSTKFYVIQKCSM